MMSSLHNLFRGFLHFDLADWQPPLFPFTSKIVVCAPHCSCGNRLTDDTLRLLASFAVQLEHLDVTCLLLLTDHGLDAATGRFPLLRSLSLGNCGRLTTGSVLRFALRAPLLSELRLPHCARVDARALVRVLEPPELRTWGATFGAAGGPGASGSGGGGGGRGDGGGGSGGGAVSLETEPRDPPLLRHALKGSLKGSTSMNRLPFVPNDRGAGSGMAGAEVSAAAAKTTTSPTGGGAAAGGRAEASSLAAAAGASAGAAGSPALPAFRLAPVLHLLDLRGCTITAQPSAVHGGGPVPVPDAAVAGKLRVMGFHEPRPGFLRRLPPRVQLGE